MFAGVTALMTRSFRLDARQTPTHLFRLAFVVFIYFSLLSAQAQAMMFGAPGLRFFHWTCHVNAVFLALAGVSLFSTALTEEKEENTLGLLRMTGLNPLGILLGKSTSRLVQVLLLLAVQVPFTFLSITLGGITMDQIVAAYAALIAFAILVANVGLLHSVVCRSGGTAAGMTFMWYILYCFCWPIGNGLILELNARGVTATTPTGSWLLAIAGWIRDANVHAAIETIMVTGFADSPISSQVISNTVVGAICFLLSWSLFDIFTRNLGPTMQTRGFALRPTSRIRFLSPGRAWKGGLVWKDFHFIAGGWPLQLVKLFLYLGAYPAIVAADMYANYGTAFFSESLTAAYLVVLCVGLVIEIALLSSRLFHDEVKGQTMSSLLMLPRSVADIGYSKAVGCLLSLGPALVCLFGLGPVLPDGARLLAEGLTQPGVWATVLGLVIFFHLTALLSLFVKWGALPLAFFIMLVSTWCCPVFAFAILALIEAVGDESRLIAVLGIWLAIAIVSFVFHMMIGARLQEVGTQ
ncbi:MAG: hypothetical protein KF777_11310 [Planctomycetaceae bacterium]|nr:hypothetical protein [Planctomycetaceae bacterium]